MIVVDANILIYTVNASDPRHRAAREWLENAITGDELMALPWISLLAFLRVSTHKGLLPHLLPLRDALDVVDAWLEQKTVITPAPGPRHAAILRTLLLHAETGGNLTSDAHLAAIAIEYDAELCTADRDFARFPGLRWRNPLIPT